MTLERTFGPDAPVRPGRPVLNQAKSQATLLSPGTRRLAYLVSQYPKVSHSFIRREILALEQRGWQIARFSIRGWDAELVDQDDIAEFAKTAFVLKGGAPVLALALLRQALRAPGRFLKAVALTIRMMRGSDRPFPWHLVYLAEACWLAQRLARDGITHMHAHFGTNPADVAMLVNALTGISYSVTIHGPEEFDRGRHIHLGEKIRRASFIVAISSFCRSQLYRTVERQYWPRIHIVHCGIDTGFSAIAAVMPAETNRLVCVGRLCEQKGQLLLVKAAAVLAAEGRKFSLVLVGDGEDRGEIERLIAEHTLADRVQILGWASAARVKREFLPPARWYCPVLPRAFPSS